MSRSWIIIYGTYVRCPNFMSLGRVEGYFDVLTTMMQKVSFGSVFAIPPTTRDFSRLSFVVALRP